MVINGMGFFGEGSCNIIALEPGQIEGGAPLLRMNAHFSPISQKHSSKPLYNPITTYAIVSHNQ